MNNFCLHCLPQPKRKSYEKHNRVEVLSIPFTSFQKETYWVNKNNEGIPDIRNQRGELIGRASDNIIKKNREGRGYSIENQWWNSHGSRILKQPLTVHSVYTEDAHRASRVFAQPHAVTSFDRPDWSIVHVTWPRSRIIFATPWTIRRLPYFPLFIARLYYSPPFKWLTQLIGEERV